MEPAVFRRWLPLVPIIAVQTMTAACGRPAAPAGDHWRIRVPVTVHAVGHARRAHAVEVPLDGQMRLGDGPFVPTAFQVVEVDDRGRLVNDRVPFQVEPPLRDVVAQDHTRGDASAAPDGRRVLVLLMEGDTEPHAARHFLLYMGTGPAGTHRTPGDLHVRVTDDVPWQGQSSVRVDTPSGTWVYHKAGAGFASLVDRDGLDWLSFRPEGGSAGHYRGIPNLVHPEGHFHPGSRTATTTIVSAGPVRTRLYSETTDGAWACTWSIDGTHATMTVLRAAGPYWFLYEGTPGGQLDEAGDEVVRSTGERTAASEHWQARLPVPRWIYVSAGSVARSIFVVHHEDDGDGDQYWPMEGNMTVFGFGREYRCCGKSLRAVPARFSVGLVESRDRAEVVRAIDAALHDVRVAVGAPQPAAAW